LCSWSLHVALCVIVANASLTGVQWVARGLSGFYSILVFVRRSRSNRLDSKQKDIKLQRRHVERTDRYDADTTETNLNRIDRAQ
jgi:hypothetical protein